MSVNRFYLRIPVVRSHVARISVATSAALTSWMGFFQARLTVLKSAPSHVLYEAQLRSRRRLEGQDGVQPNRPTYLCPGD